jgi:hypothetical protein
MKIKELWPKIVPFVQRVNDWLKKNDDRLTQALIAFIQFFGTLLVAFSVVANPYATVGGVPFGLVIEAKFKAGIVILAIGYLLESYYILSKK